MSTTKTTPLEYIKRTRYYYQQLGYPSHYQWAHNEQTPFTPLTKPLNECCVGIVTTAAPFQHNCGDQAPRAAYNSAAKFYKVYAKSTDRMPDLRISHIAIDRDHTMATDIGSYFPLVALQQAKAHHIIGRVADRFYGLPTNRSQRTTIATDAQELLKLCSEDAVDIALLLPNCPVCHQSVSLAARTLEQAGVVSVVMGCAKDIVEHAGVPRFLFSDYPLGNAAGRPHDKSNQADTLQLALNLASSATSPNTTKQSPHAWKGASNWKDDYSNPDKLSTQEIQEKRAAFDAQKNVAKHTQQSQH